MDPQSAVFSARVNRLLETFTPDRGSAAARMPASSSGSAAASQIIREIERRQVLRSAEVERHTRRLRKKNDVRERDQHRRWESRGSSTAMGEPSLIDDFFPPHSSHLRHLRERTAISGNTAAKAALPPPESPPLWSSPSVAPHFKREEEARRSNQEMEEAFGERDAAPPLLPAASPTEATAQGGSPLLPIPSPSPPPPPPLSSTSSLAAVAMAALQDEVSELKTALLNSLKELRKQESLAASAVSERDELRGEVEKLSAAVRATAEEKAEAVRAPKIQSAEGGTQTEAKGEQQQEEGDRRHREELKTLARAVSAFREGAQEALAGVIALPAATDEDNGPTSTEQVVLSLRSLQSALTPALQTLRSDRAASKGLAAAVTEQRDSALAERDRLRLLLEEKEVELARTMSQAAVARMQADTSAKEKDEATRRESDELRAKLFSTERVVAEKEGRVLDSQREAEGLKAELHRAEASLRTLKKETEEERAELERTLSVREATASKTASSLHEQIRELSSSLLASGKTREALSVRVAELEERLELVTKAKEDERRQLHRAFERVKELERELVAVQHQFHVDQEKEKEKERQEEKRRQDRETSSVSARPRSARRKTSAAEPPFEVALASSRSQRYGEQEAQRPPPPPPPPLVLPLVIAAPPVAAPHVAAPSAPAVSEPPSVPLPSAAAPVSDKPLPASRGPIRLVSPASFATAVSELPEQSPSLLAKPDSPLARSKMRPSSWDDDDEQPTPVAAASPQPSPRPLPALASAPALSSPAPAATTQPLVLVDFDSSSEAGNSESRRKQESEGRCIEVQELEAPVSAVSSSRPSSASSDLTLEPLSASASAAGFAGENTKADAAASGDSSSVSSSSSFIAVQVHTLSAVAVILATPVQPTVTEEARVSTSSTSSSSSSDGTLLSTSSLGESEQPQTLVVKLRGAETAATDRREHEEHRQLPMLDLSPGAESKEQEGVQEQAQASASIAVSPAVAVLREAVPSSAGHVVAAPPPTRALPQVPASPAAKAEATPQLPEAKTKPPLIARKRRAHLSAPPDTFTLPLAVPASIAQATEMGLFSSEASLSPPRPRANQSRRFSLGPIPEKAGTGEELEEEEGDEEYNDNVAEEAMREVAESAYRVASLSPEDVRGFTSCKTIGDATAVLAGAICILLGEKPSWRQACLLMQDPSFSSRVVHSDPLSISHRSMSILRGLVETKGLRAHAEKISSPAAPASLPSLPAERALARWALACCDLVEAVSEEVKRINALATSGERSAAPPSPALAPGSPLLLPSPATSLLPASSATTSPSPSPSPSPTLLSRPPPFPSPSPPLTALPPPLQTLTPTASALASPLLSAASETSPSANAIRPSVSSSSAPPALTLASVPVAQPAAASSSTPTSLSARIRTAFSSPKVAVAPMSFAAPATPGATAAPRQRPRVCMALDGAPAHIRTASVAEMVQRLTCPPHGSVPVGITVRKVPQSSGLFARVEERVLTIESKAGQDHLVWQKAGGGGGDSTAATGAGGSGAKETGSSAPSSVPLSELLEVVSGLATRNLRAKGAKAKAHLYLSLVFQSRTLDIEITSASERDYLSEGFRGLIKLLHYQKQTGSGGGGEGGGGSGTTER